MRSLVVTLLVLLGLLVAVDFGAAAFVESTVSRQMRDQLGLADDPSVRINGFPFLTQVLGGRYSSVDVSASRLAVGELTDIGISAQLRDIDLPLDTLLGGGPPTLVVNEVEGTVRVGPADLERLLPGVEDLRIETLDAQALQAAVDDGADASLAGVDPDTAARLAGTTTLLGNGETPVAVIAVLTLIDGRARIEPRDVRLGDGDTPPLPAQVQAALREQFAVQVDPGSLPLQVTPTAFRAQDGVLEISGVSGRLELGG